MPWSALRLGLDAQCTALSNRSRCLPFGLFPGSAPGHEGVLGQELSDQAGPTGSQAGAHRQFGLSPRGPGQQKVRHVDAGDEENAEGGGQHHPHDSPDLLGHDTAEVRIDYLAPLEVDAGEEPLNLWGRLSP